MQKFVRLLSTVAMVTILASGVAFAATDTNGLLIPKDLSPTTDAYAISQDQVGANSGDLLKVYDVESDKTLTLTDYNLALVPVAGHTPNLEMSTNDTYAHIFGPIGDGWVEKEYFDKLLLRSTASTMELTFNVTSFPEDDDILDLILNPGGIWFGLAGGFEFSTTPTTRVLAQDCTLACSPYFHHYMQHELISSDTTLPKTMVDSITWDGTGDSEFYVECCNDNFKLAMVLSGDVTTELSGDATPGLMDPETGYYTDSSKDIVIAHLSETPFLRVRTTEAMNVGANSADFRAWKDSYFFDDDAVDVPEGETYNMGVQYSEITDCACCAAGACCANVYVPYLAVTNLGTVAVYNGNNILASTGLVLKDQNQIVDTNDSWLCNSWCGLCEYDDFMSGDFGSLRAGSDAKIADQSSLSDCPCHIFPAFTNTVKTAGNMDINYRANKTVDGDINNSVVTKIAGRFNTSWTKFSVGTGGLCATCENNINLYDPCECLVEVYKKALGMVVSFVEDGHLTLESYNDMIADDATATANDYAVVDAVIEDTATTSKDILLTKLSWTLTAANLTDAGLVDGTNWWRSDMWNKLKITINGIDLTPANVENVSANDLTTAELSFLTVVDGPQRTLTATTDVDVDLFVFVVDSNEAAVKYYKNTKGNRFLVVYDGAKDGKFSYKAYVSRATDAPVSADFAVAPATLELNLASADLTTATLTAANAPEGAEIVWTVASTDFATVSPAMGATTTVTGVAVGEVVVTAMVSGDDATSADCAVTIIDEAPVVPSGDSSGGCNAVGFAPAMLLLVTPLVFFLKK